MSLSLSLSLPVALTLNPDSSYLSPTLIRRALLHAPPARLLLRVRSITFAQQAERRMYHHVPPRTFHMLYFMGFAYPAGRAYHVLTTHLLHTAY